MSRPVLVIDDDADTRVLLCTCLSMLGQEVISASTAPEGLEKARNSNPCLILLDYMMPGMSGSDFRLLQLSDETIAGIPVLLTTAHPEAGSLADELDVQDVLEKPVHLDQLIKAVERYRTVDPDIETRRE